MNRLLIKLMLRWLVILVAAGNLFGCAVQPTPPAHPQPSKKQVEKQVQPDTSAKAKAQSKKKARPVKKVKEQPSSSEKPVAVKDRPDLQELSSQNFENGEASGDDVVLGRAVFHYDYYPDPEVYFDTIRHLYFYRDDGKWTMSVALPSVYQKNLGSSVRLKIDSSRPYERHREHREVYPPGTGGRNF